MSGAAVSGQRKRIYNRCVRGAGRGSWPDIFNAMGGAEGGPNRLFIDSTCIKVHRTAGGANGGGLGQRYRPDTRRQKLQGSRRLRLEGSPLCADYNPENFPDMKVPKA